MDFETTSLSGSQLLQQFQSTLAQYAPDYAQEARQYEQAKDSLPDSTYPDAYHSANRLTCDYRRTRNSHKKISNWVEWQADALAAALLMPKDAILKEVETYGNYR